jgi:hypothetical protein
MHLPAKSMVYGYPARAIRELNKDELSSSRIACRVYLDLVVQYRSGSIKSYENSRVVDYGKDA